RAAEPTPDDHEGKRKHHERDGPGDRVEPDGGIEVEPELGMELRQVLADVAAREVGEALEDPDERERDRERGESEVRPGETRRRQSEEEAAPSGDEPGDRDRPEVAPAVVDDEHGRRVGADANERAVSERDMAREAGEHV